MKKNVNDNWIPDSTRNLRRVLNAFEKEDHIVRTLRVPLIRNTHEDEVPPSAFDSSPLVTFCPLPLEDQLAVMEEVVGVADESGAQAMEGVTEGPEMVVDDASTMAAGSSGVVAGSSQK